MSHTSRPAERGTQGPQGPLEVLLRAMEGPGDAGEPVVDPDMVALFEEFLGEAGSTEEAQVFHGATKPKGRPYHYVMRDTEQRGLCLHEGRLVATALQGANNAQEEPISVVPNPVLERRRCPLIVGIRGGSHALSCGIGPEPQLKIEEVGLLDLFSRGPEATPYTFYKTYGGSTHTFEAAAFPGRFLSTALGPGEALTLAPPPDVTAFYLRRK